MKKPDKIKFNLEYFLERYGIFLALAAVFSAHVFFIGRAQIWDGYIYFDGFLRAMAGTHSLADFFSNFNIIGHPTMGYILLISLGQLVARGNYVALDISNLLLVFLATWSFYKILLFFRKDQTKQIEIFLLTLLFALNPLFFAVSISFNTDFPVLVFMTAALYAYSYRRYYLLSLFGLLLVFSKEVGVVLYGGIVFFLALADIAGRADIRKKSEGEKRKFFWRRFAVLLPVILAAFFYLVFNRRGNWTGGSWFALGWGWTVVKTRLFQIFGMNFSWIYTGFILLAILFFVASKSRLADFIRNQKERLTVLLLFFILWAGFIIMNLFFKTFVNPRYVSPTIFFLIFFFSFALDQLISKIQTRIALLVLLLLLAIGQIYCTLDPVSRSFFGTIPFGRHKILKMTSLTGECCGIAGRDQLVYNAQFAAIPMLLDKLYAEIPITQESNIVVNSLADFYLFTPVDIASRKRTMQKNNVFIPRVYGLDQVSRGDAPQRAYYVYMPWMAEAAKELEQVQKFFRVEDKKVIEYNGYTLDVYSIIRK